MLNLEDIKKAHERIRGRINHTPVMTSRTIDRMTGCKVYYKCENFQRAGAFKIRGAFNTILQLTKDEKKKGVVAHSSGNHAQAVALASSMIGVKATIVMPTNSPDVKVNATRGYGAEVVFCEPTVESRVKVAQELVEKDSAMAELVKKL